MTFWPSTNKYRDFEFREGDSDDVGTNHWDCPTCVYKMPPLTNAKKGDIFECQNCGTKMQVTHEPYTTSITRVEMIEQGEEARPRLVLEMANGMRLLL